MSNSLRPHELQHARPPYTSPTPRVHPNPCPLCWWCHLTISSFANPFSSCSQSFPASGSFPMSLFFASGDCSREIKRHLLLGIKAMTNLDSILKAETLLCQQNSVQSKLWFFSSHVWTWELDYKEGWLKNWCFWTLVLEKTLESPLDCYEIQRVNPKGN